MYMNEKIFHFGTLSLATLSGAGLEKGVKDSLMKSYYPDLCDGWVSALHYSSHQPKCEDNNSGCSKNQSPPFFLLLRQKESKLSVKRGGFYCSVVPY